jgi:hypothetical protein
VLLIPTSVQLIPAAELLNPATVLLDPAAAQLTPAAGLLNVTAEHLLPAAGPRNPAAPRFILRTRTSIVRPRSTNLLALSSIQRPRISIHLPRNSI